jgi:catalase
MVPVQPFAAANTTAANRGNRNYLFEALIASMRQRPLQWHLIITVGQPSDVTNDPSIPWPDGREHVDVGTLSLNSVESDDTSPARDINFDPLVLPAGIVPSDDPLLSARSAVYSQSYTRRAGETKTPSAVTPSEVRK